MTACASAVDAAEETPATLALPNALKVGQGEAQTCHVARFAGAVGKTSDLKPACVPACSQSCAGALDVHQARLLSETGFGMQPGERSRVEKACLRSCAYECTKPGRAFEFVVPFRCAALSWPVTARCLTPGGGGHSWQTVVNDDLTHLTVYEVPLSIVTSSCSARWGCGWTGWPRPALSGWRRPPAPGPPRRPRPPAR